MKRRFCLIPFVCFIALGLSVSVIAAGSDFSDTKGHWAEKAIMRWTENGTVQGYDGKFRPNDTVTRAELATILNRMLKYPDSKENRFSDVKESDWFYQAAVNLKKQEVLLVTGKFEGNSQLVRSEAAYMIAMAFGIKDSSPVDFTSFHDLTNATVTTRWAIKEMHYRGYLGAAAQTKKR